MKRLLTVVAVVLVVVLVAGCNEPTPTPTPQPIPEDASDYPAGHADVTVLNATQSMLKYPGYHPVKK